MITGVKNWHRTPNADTTIYYVVIYGEGADTQPLSPFRGHYIVDLVSVNFQFAAAHMPSNVRQLFDSPEQRFLLRSYGRQNCKIAILSLPEAAAFIDYVDPQFLIVYFDPVFTDHIDALERRLGWPILRIAHPMRELERIQPTCFARPNLLDLVIDYVGHVLALIRTKSSGDALSILGDSGRKPPEWQFLDKASARCFFHNATYPNDALYFLAGYQIDISQKPDYALPDRLIIERIANQVTEIIDNRNRFRRQKGIKSDFQNDLILFFPHYFLELFFDEKETEKWMKSRDRREKKLRKLQSSDLKRSVEDAAPHTDDDPFLSDEMSNFITLLSIQNTFSFSIPVLPGLANPMESEEGRAYVDMQTAETAASTVGATILATNNSAPVLRWSPSLRSSFEALFEFVDVYRRSDQAIPSGPLFRFIPPRHPEQDEIARAFNAFVQQAQAFTPQPYLDFIRRSGAIKLFADFPFEWMRSATLPISYTTELSRVPHTPAKIAMDIIRRSGRRIELTQADIQTIRVLTSFSRDDNLRGKFCNDLQAFFTDAEVPIKLEEIEVRQPREFMEAFVDPPGKIVIIDMHGDIRRDGLGVLRLEHIGFSSIDFEAELEHLTQQRSAFASAPSIVLLSACDTFSPLSQSFSIATALMGAGATTVLGTLLPIDAYRSAGFISKILMDAYFFLTQEEGAELSWRLLVCDAFAYVAAINWFGSCQQAFNKVFKDVPSYVEAISRAFASRAGNVLGAEDRLIASLAAIFGEGEARIRDVLVTEAPYIDPMNYVQLGFPERITLYGPPHTASQLRLPSEIDLLEHGYFNPRLQRKSEDR